MHTTHVSGSAGGDLPNPSLLTDTLDLDPSLEAYLLAEGRPPANKQV